MYELGLRLALTNKPVIMFREEHPDNERIFDISVYHTKEYAVTRYRELEDYIIAKLSKYETGTERFSSPVLDILATEPSIVRDIQMVKVTGLLGSIHQGLGGLLRGAGGALHYFLKVCGSDLTVPPKADALLGFIQKNRGSLQPLDWKTFRFKPSVPPGLHSFLSTLPLGEIAPEWLAKLWNSVFSEYYIRFFGTDLYWRFMEYDSVQNFVGETVVVRASLTDLLLFFQKGTPPERATELNDMLNHLKQCLDLPAEGLEALRAEIPAASEWHG
jgi:hypothetical protein